MGVELLNIFEGLGVCVMWFISYLYKKGTANVLSCRNVIKKITSDVFFLWSDLVKMRLRGYLNEVGTGLAHNMICRHIFRAVWR